VKHDILLSFDYPSETAAQVVERSLQPEIGAIDDERSRASLECEGKTVTIQLAASDLAALRAGVNTWCSLVSVAERASGVDSSGMG